MKLLARYAIAAAALLAAAQAVAQPAAVVEGVQMPAWVERSGRTSPVAPGMALQAGDQLRTGAGSRLLVKLSEGSLVKLGENGRLTIAEMSPTQEVFRAALRVLEGAFRFTTDLAARPRKREVNIRVKVGEHVKGGETIIADVPAYHIPGDGIRDAEAVEAMVV